MTQDWSQHNDQRSTDCPHLQHRHDSLIQLDTSTAPIDRPISSESSASLNLVGEQAVCNVHSFTTQPWSAFIQHLTSVTAKLL